MPTQEATKPKKDRQSFESRVRFSGRLVGAVLVTGDAAQASPAHPRPPVGSAPQLPPVPAAAPTPTPAPPAPPVPAAPLPLPEDFWKTDIARELLADRARIEEVLRGLQTTAAEVRKDQRERLSQWETIRGSPKPTAITSIPAPIRKAGGRKGAGRPPGEGVCIMLLRRGGPRRVRACQGRLAAAVVFRRPGECCRPAAAADWWRRP